MRLFSNRSQMTSKCGKNKQVAHEAQPSVSLMFLPHFDVLCDLLLNRRTATWNLFVKYLVCQAHGYLSLYYNKKTMHWVLKYRVFPLHHSTSSGKRFPLAKFCNIHRKTTPRLYKQMAFPSNCSNSFFKKFPFQATAPYK